MRGCHTRSKGALLSQRPGKCRRGGGRGFLTTIKIGPDPHKGTSNTAVFCVSESRSLLPRGRYIRLPCILFHSFAEQTSIRSHFLFSQPLFQMALLTIFLLALATVVPTQAFTNGSLVPAYFCHPEPDGMPKALGELLPYLLEDNTGPIAFNNNCRFPS